MEKLLNAKLKLRREEVAIRAAILRREQEQNQQKPTSEMDLVLTEPMPFEWTWNNSRISEKSNRTYRLKLKLIKYSTNNVYMFH